MTRTRKWLVGIAAAIGVLVVVLLVAMAWLVYTPSGLRFALDRGVAMTHGQFAYAGASGTLAGETTINGLHYRDGGGDRLQIKRVVLDLQPWALLGKRLHVRRARIDGIELDLAPSQSSSQSSGFSLEPPLTIAVDDSLLTHITIRQAGKPVFAADSLAIAGLWGTRRLKLDTLDLRAPDGHVELDGTLSLARGYRGKGRATIDWTRGDTRYVGKITSQSDGKQAQLHADVSAPIRLKLDAGITLDKRHAWTVALDVPRFDARDLPTLPSSLETLALSLHGGGNAQGGELQGTLVANDHTVLIDPAQFRYDGKSLTLDPLRLRSSSMPGTATATGTVHLDASPVTASLDVAWQDVRLPADLVGQELATHGQVHLEGSAKQFGLKGALAIGPQGHLSDVQVDLAGTPQAIELHTLKLVQKNGGLDAYGIIGLQPRTTWKLDAVAKRFDPGAILAGWNGALDFTLATQGELTRNGPQATVKLGDVGGNLRGRNVAGSRADFRITPGNLLDGSLLLVTGGSRVHAQGTSGNHTHATVSVDIASLNDWAPRASGDLHGRFDVTGAWPALGVRGQLHGDKLDVSTYHADTLQLHASIADISKPGGDLELILDGVRASGLDFDQVKLAASGTATAHRATLDARGKQLGVALSVQGGWQAKSRRWSGTLSGVELAPQGIPEWRQLQPSAIGWQNGAVTFAQFCLTAGVPRLCLAGSRNAKGVIDASYDLQQLPLQLLASLAPGFDRLQASGDISGSGRLAIDPDGTISGQATLTAGTGNIVYASTPDHPLLAWTRIDANLDATGGRQQIKLQGSLADGGHLGGDVSITGTDHVLEGSIDAKLQSLAFLEALTPEIANVHGSLAGQLTVSGTLSAPRFQGRIQTEGFSAELPRAGLKLHDGNFGVVGDQDGRLRVEGRIASGEGVLHVTGDAGFSADAPLALDLKGDNVLVADIPAARVVASPDLHIERSGGMFALTGSVTIPSARIEAEKLPGQGPAQASPDVVIVDKPQTAEVTPLAMQGDIKVELGDRVEVQGYGFDGKVQGSLAVRVRPNQAATGSGEIRINGKYQAYGQNLTIERGRLLFAGTRLDNPGLDVRAVRNLRNSGITVGLSIRGTARQPMLTVFSNPTMEQAEALSYLVTGRPLDQLKSGEGDTLNTAAQALGGLAGDRLAKSIGSRLGLEAGVSSSEALGGSAFTAGKYLSPRLFLSYGVGLFTPGQVVTLRYTLNRFLQFEAENATTGNRASFNYKIEK